MLIKANSTPVEAEVKAVRPRPDGWGADVDLEVRRNLAAADEDFLRPRPGDVLTAFSAEPHLLRAGQAARLRLSLLAGPGGGRTVIESAEPLAGQ
jgi:hypothetical protein